MVRVYSINVSPVKGKTVSLREASLKSGKGITGDRHNGGDREVSLTAMEALALTKELEGLCTSKFSANIVTEGLDYATLHKGDVLSFGDCALELTEVGKTCYDQCPLSREGKRCLLRDSCAFGRVIREGMLRVGATVHKGI